MTATTIVTRPSRWPIGAAILALAFLAAPARARVETRVQFKGRVNAEVAAYGSNMLGRTEGTLTLRLVPEGATILYAGLYACGAIETTDPPAARFDGRALGTAAAFDSAASGNNSYRWDVRPYVRGAGDYRASAQPFFFVAGLALVVVYSHPTLPWRTVVVNDGATSVGTGHTYGREATTFVSVGEGFGEAWVYVAGDDASASGEKIWLDGVVVGGPLDGLYRGGSSLVWVAGTTSFGTIALEIETFGDWILFGLAVLVAPAPCDDGNVNTAFGPPRDVLFVNGSAGGSDRTIVLGARDPLSISVAAPPSATGSAPFALYAWSGLPDRPTELPAGLGTACRPMPLVEVDSRLRAIWNNIGRFSRLGFPSLPSSPAPSLVFSAPNGAGRAATILLQGLILDSASPSGVAAVTNGVTVIVR